MIQVGDRVKEIASGDIATVERVTNGKLFGRFQCDGDDEMWNYPASAVLVLRDDEWVAEEAAPPDSLPGLKP